MRLSTYSCTAWLVGKWYEAGLDKAACMVYNDCGTVRVPIRRRSGKPYFLALLMIQNGKWGKQIFRLVFKF